MELSDIQLMLPERDHHEIYLNFCYCIGMTINISNIPLYKKYNIGPSWSPRFDFERFNLTLKEQFEIENNRMVVLLEFDTITYIRRYHICFQFNDDPFTRVNFFIRSKNLTKEADYMFVQFGKKVT